MVFSSVIFLFAFLPVALGVYYLLPSLRTKNLWLLAASLWFYAWGELRYLPLLLTSIGVNFVFAWLVFLHPKGSRSRGWWLMVAVSANLGLLVYYKYWCFLLANLAPWLGWLGWKGELPTIPLPLGISFFTFHALSYVIDVARGQVKVQKSPLRLALYISLFPQLVAGPIVRYGHVAHELRIRRHSWEDFAYGVYRFVVGLSKKVLIANVVGVTADHCFALPVDRLTSVHATLGVICYSLQIYCDFSGYSDMAIGLGRMFGFHFRENFDLPYWATSITDFWKRWHISLTSWFRDYLYVPLTGNQFWVSPARAYSAMLIVFLLCGFWHGASWTFVAWGLLHGMVLVGERAFLLTVLARWPVVLQRTYSLGLVMVGWILFRSDSFAQAWSYLGAVFRLRDWLGFDARTLHEAIGTEGWAAMVIGLLAATPWLRSLGASWVAHERQGVWRASPVGTVALLALFAVAAAKLASSSFNPFIYYRF